MQDGDRSVGRTLVRSVDAIAYTIVVIATSVMVIATGLQVVFRFIVAHPLYWSEEVSRYAFVWAVFVGSAITVKGKAHIAVDYLVGFFPQRVQKALHYIVPGIVAIFLVTVISQSFRVVRVNMRQTSPAIGIPMGYIYLAIPVGCALMLFYTIINTLHTDATSADTDDRSGGM